MSTITLTPDLQAAAECVVRHLQRVSLSSLHEARFDGMLRLWGYLIGVTDEEVALDIACDIVGLYEGEVDPARAKRVEIELPVDEAAH